MQTNYVTEASFHTYIEYLALKRHFTNDTYDYHKYSGKVSASYNSFQTRNDAFYFYKLSKLPEVKNLLLSNLVKNPSIYIRDLCDDTAETVYLDWKKRIDGLSYHLSSDLNKLKEDYKSNFVIPIDGQHPHLMSLFLQKQISLETFAILTNISNTLEYWSKEIVDKTISPELIRKSKKYYPFLEFDRKKIQKIIKDQFFFNSAV